MLLHGQLVMLMQIFWTNYGRYVHKLQNVKKVMTNHNNSYLFVCALCISYYNHTLSGESNITTRLKTRSK